MTLKFSFGYIIAIILIYNKVASWTIDLPEVRRYLFEKNEREKNYNSFVSNKQTFYDNIDENSKHNSKSGKYGDSVHSDPKNVKEVLRVVEHGSAYLEGLRRAVERYIDFLENCTSTNYTRLMESDVKATFVQIHPKWIGKNASPLYNDQQFERMILFGRYAETWSEFIQKVAANYGHSFLPSIYREINTSRNSTWLPRHEVPVTPAGVSETANQSLTVLNGNFTESLMNLTLQNMEKSRSGNFSTGAGTTSLCQNVTRTSEYVRRLAQLAVTTTKRLQDLAYAEEYKNDNGKEEDELIFKLAWFLDRLAQMTGFVPNPKLFMQEEPRQTTTTIPFPMVPSSLPVPPDVVRYMTLCLKMDSPVPATVRCSVPIPMPPGMVGPVNTTDNAATTLQPPATGDLASTVDSTPEQSSLELLMATDSFTPSIIYNSLKHIQKRSTTWLNDKPPLSRELSDLINDKTITKRSMEENPMINLMKYYVKHSVWVNANPNNNFHEKSGSKSYEVKNHLPAIKSVKKRSLVIKRSNNIRISDIIVSDLNRYVKTKPRIAYFKDHLEKVKKILQSIITKHRLLNHKHKLPKPFKIVKKRSIKYERVHLPRISENPMQDNSYYIKNKHGTEYSPSVLQAAQARAALERHFQNGNILVVRQYGANYNPLVPSQFYAGVFRMVSDV